MGEVTLPPHGEIKISEIAFFSWKIIPGYCFVVFDFCYLSSFDAFCCALSGTNMGSAAPRCTRSASTSSSSACLVSPQPLPLKPASRTLKPCPYAWYLLNPKPYTRLPEPGKPSTANPKTTSAPMRCHYLKMRVAGPVFEDMAPWNVVLEGSALGYIDHDTQVAATCPRHYSLLLVVVSSLAWDLSTDEMGRPRHGINANGRQSQNAGLVGRVFVHTVILFVPESEKVNAR